MNQIRQYNIDYHITEPDLHNHNLVEGIIGELQRKWYRIMIQNYVQEALELWITLIFGDVKPQLLHSV